MASSSRSVPVADDVGRILGDLEAHLDVALRAEVVDLVRAKVIKERGERAGVGEVGIVQKEARAGLVEILVDVVDAVAC